MLSGCYLSGPFVFMQAVWC